MAEIAPPEENLPTIEADESLPIIEADESLPVVEAELEQNKIEIEDKDDEVNIADKVSEKIFSGMIREYNKYLESGSDDDKGINTLYRAMKKAGLKSSVFKKITIFSHK